MNEQTHNNLTPSVSLKEFIRDTLAQIYDGVEEVKTTKEGKAFTIGTPAPTAIHFDIAVTASGVSQKTSSIDGKLSGSLVTVISAGTTVGHQETISTENSAISRVAFEVYINLPHSNTQVNSLGTSSPRR